MCHSLYNTAVVSFTCPRTRSWKTRLSSTKLSARNQGSTTFFLPSFFSARHLLGFPPFLRHTLFVHHRRQQTVTAAVRMLASRLSAAVFGVGGQGTLRPCPLPCRRWAFAGVAAHLGLCPPRWRVDRSAGPCLGGSGPCVCTTWQRVRNGVTRLAVMPSQRHSYLISKSMRWTGLTGRPRWWQHTTVSVPHNAAVPTFLARMTAPRSQAAGATCAIAVSSEMYSSQNSTGPLIGNPYLGYGS